MHPQPASPKTTAAAALRGTRAITSATLIAVAAMLIVSGVVLWSDGPVVASADTVLTGS